MEKALRYFILLFVICFNLKGQIPNPIYFNTASNASATGVLPVGSNDLNWMASNTGTAGPFVPAKVCGNQAPCCWMSSATPNVDWITYPHTCSASPAEHSCLGSVDEYFKLSFNLPSNNPCGQSITQTNAYCLAIDFYSDNCVWEIFVNGVSYYLSTQSNPYYYTGFSSSGKTFVQICSGWQPGTNNIIVHIKSGSNPYPTWSGFMAEVKLTQSSTSTSYTSAVTLTASPSQTICNSASVTLSVTGAANYTWAPGNITGSSISVSPSANTIYTVAASSGGCIGTATTAVSVISGPTLNLSNTGPVCAGNGATVTASGAASYTWQPGGSTSSSIIVNPATTTTYTVTGVNGFCSKTASTTIVVNNNPQLSVSNTSVCAGNVASLTASGASNYTWNPGGATSSTITISPTSNTIYTVTGSIGNCVGTATAQVNVVANPTINIIGTGAICDGNPATLSVSGASTYTWMPGSITGSLINVSPSITTTYTVIGQNNGCYDTQTTSVNVYSISAQSSTICSGGTATLNAFGATNYTWNPGNFTGSSITVNPTVSTTYTVNGSIGGCSATAVVNVSVSPKPIADFYFAPLTPVDGDIVAFTDASYNSIVSWNWYFTNSAQYTYSSENPAFTFPDPGTYVTALIVKNAQGCTDTITKVIEVKEDYVFYIPNAFTPNNDGLNDIFQPKGTGISKYEMRIFDRWGEQIFETKEFEKGWDGTYQVRGSAICPSDVYVYKIKLSNIYNKSYEFTGHVSLIK